MFGIVIVNYKNEQLTIDYLQKELCKVQSPHVTIVVNNAATDLSNGYLCNALHATLISDITAPLQSSEETIFVLDSRENLGFAKGNNWAVDFLQAHFSCDYIVFSNNDIQIIDVDVCEQLIAAMETNSHIGVIGPKVVGLKGEYQSPLPYVSFMNRYCWMYVSTPFISNKKKREIFQLDYAANALEGEHYIVSGCFFAVRTQDFIKCGMMDPNTFLYAEETILAERMKNINRSVYYLPSVSVLHAHGLTTEKNLGRKGINKYLMESDIYYYREYMKTPKWKIIIGSFVYRLYCKLKSR